MSDYQLEQQQKIIEFLHVKPDFSPREEVVFRIDFIKKQLILTKQNVLVLGISGGVDSTVTGRLCQLAAEELRQEGINVRFIAVRLPYGIQKDELDAQKAVNYIKPDELITINIQPATDATLHSLPINEGLFKDNKHQDFVVGNIKARQRMVAQYAVAGARSGLVVGTDHAAEALMGFYTKFGDGACDITPLTGLNKRRVRGVGSYLKAPLELVEKCPTADLETLSPLLPDEVALGVTYNQIDDFLEGKIIEEHAFEIILKTFTKTTHKRAMPISPYDV